MRQSNEDILRYINTMPDSWYQGRSDLSRRIDATPNYTLPLLIWDSESEIPVDNTPHECEVIQRMSEAWRNKSND